MALTDISLLFKDIIETPQQKRQRLFTEGQAAAGQYTGLPTGLRELAMGTASGIPNMVESIRQFGAGVGLPVQTQGEQLQRSMGGLNITDPTDQAEMVRLLANSGNPGDAAALVAIFQEENQKQTDRARRIEREIAEEARAVSGDKRARDREIRLRATEDRLEEARLEELRRNAAEEAAEEQSAENLMSLYGTMEEQTNDPVLKMVMRSAIQNQVSDINVVNTASTIMSRGDPSVIEQKVLDTTLALMEMTENGEPLFTDEAQARNLAVQLANGYISTDVDEDGVVRITSVMDAISGKENPTIVIRPDNPTVLGVPHEGQTIWDNRDLLSGAWNIAYSAWDVPESLLGFDELVNTTRTQAQQQIETALGLLRTAFNEDSRLTKVEIDTFADEIRLKPRLFDSPLLWENRAISVDRSLRRTLTDISTEHQNSNDVDRRSVLSQRAQAIDNFRRELGVPRILDIGRVTIENIGVFSKQELQDILKRTSDKRIVEWETANPDVAAAINVIFE